MSDQDTAVVEPQAADAADEAQTTDTAADEPGEALLSALRAERATVKALRDELEKARLEGLSETERAVEEARRAGYEAAMSEASRRLKVTMVVTRRRLWRPSGAIRQTPPWTR